MIEHDYQVKAQRFRAGHAVRLGGGFRLAGSSRQRHSFDRGRGVLVRGGYRYHKGQKAKSDASGKTKAHVKYLAGDRHKEAEKERRGLFDDRGNKQSSSQAFERHSDAFIEHRIVISPSTRESKVTEKDLHVLAQASVQEIRSRNPKCEVEASYAVHTDTEKPHAHLLLTSKNNLRISKSDYADLREMNRDLRIELERERGIEGRGSGSLELEAAGIANTNKIDLGVTR